MSTTTSFQVGDHQLTVSRLKVKDSLRGLRLVGKVLLPALAEAHSAPAGQVGNAVSKAIEGLDCLPELLDLFAPVTKWAGPTGSTALQPFIEDVFGGRPDHVVEYLVKCVQTEYGSFLVGGGPLAKLWGQAKAAAETTAAPAAVSSSTPS